MSRKRRPIPNYQESKQFCQVVKPKTRGQSLLVDTISKNLITFVTGIAGTGKSHLAMGCAIGDLFNGYVKRVILTRPIIEVGQSIGALPGTYQEKIHPYLVPLFEEMKNFLPENSNYHKCIDVLPLNLMRGVTFKETFVVADEFQNASFDQIKMLLTRFGQGSKMVITGDLGQSDLPLRFQGGLARFIEKLVDVELVGIVNLGKEDLIRHEIIGRILSRLE